MYLKVLQALKSQDPKDLDELWVVKQIFSLPAMLFQSLRLFHFGFPNTQVSPITNFSSGSAPCSESQAGGLLTCEVMIPLLIMLPTPMWLIRCDLSPPAWPYPTQRNFILGSQLLLSPSISLLFYLDNEPWTDHSETSLL